MGEVGPTSVLETFGKTDGPTTWISNRNHEFGIDPPPPNGPGTLDQRRLVQLQDGAAAKLPETREAPVDVQANDVIEIFVEGAESKVWSQRFFFIHIPSKIIQALRDSIAHKVSRCGACR